MYVVCIDLCIIINYFDRDNQHAYSHWAAQSPSASSIVIVTMLAKITRILILFLLSQTSSSPSPKPRPFFPWSPLCQFSACGHGQFQFGLFGNIFSNKDSLFNQIFGQQQLGVAPFPVSSTTTTTDDTSDINVDIPLKPLNEDEEIMTLDEDHDATPLKEVFEKPAHDSAENVTANVVDDENTKSNSEKEKGNIKTESDLEGIDKPMLSKPTEISTNSAKETEETKTFGNQTIDAGVTDLPTEEQTYADEPDIELF